MAEPLTLGLVGGIVLAEGVKFLYHQASQLLERRRKADEPTLPEEGLPQTGNGVLRRPLASSVPTRDLSAPSRVVLADLVRYLTPYVTGERAVDPGDEAFVAAADAVRQLLEIAYDRDLSFVDEPRTSGALSGVVDVDQVAGYAAAVRLRVAVPRSISGRVRAGTVDAGGEVIGVDVDQQAT